MFEVVNLIANIVLASSACLIAYKANHLIKRSVRVEVDKHIFEWGQRCLKLFSQISSLRLRDENNIDIADFRECRRKIRAELIALKEEGLLFFHDGGAQENRIVAPLANVIRMVDGRNFLPPAAGDYDGVRQPQNQEIREQVHQFINEIQNTVSNEWILES